MDIQSSGAKCPHCGKEKTFIIKQEYLENSDEAWIYAYNGLTVVCDECGKFIAFLPPESNPKGLSGGVAMKLKSE